MKKILLIPKLMLVVLLVFGFSQAALAEDTPTADTAVDKKEQKKQQKEEQKEEQKKEQTEFVDRNGDGIQDGQEHRFRGKHRRRGKSGTDEEGSGERRHRARGSKGRP